MTTFGSRSMDIAVSTFAVISGLVTAVAGHLWSSAVLCIAACIPWLRIVTVNMMNNHRDKMVTLKRVHEERVRTLEAEIKRLRNMG